MLIDFFHAEATNLVLINVGKGDRNEPAGVISSQRNEGQFILSRTADGDRKMRDRLIIGLCLAALGWPNPALAQQSASHALEALPLWAQLALLIGPVASAIFAAIGLLLGLLLNFYQSRRTNAQARAALVAESLKSF